MVLSATGGSEYQIKYASMLAHPSDDSEYDENAWLIWRQLLGVLAQGLSIERDPSANYKADVPGPHLLAYLRNYNQNFSVRFR